MSINHKPRNKKNKLLILLLTFEKVLIKLNNLIKLILFKGYPYIKANIYKGFLNINTQLQLIWRIYK